MSIRVEERQTPAVRVGSKPARFSVSTVKNRRSCAHAVQRAGDRASGPHLWTERSARRVLRSGRQPDLRQRRAEPVWSGRRHGWRRHRSGSSAARSPPVPAMSKVSPAPTPSPSPRLAASILAISSSVAACSAAMMRTRSISAPWSARRPPAAPCRSMATWMAARVATRSSSAATPMSRPPLAAMCWAASASTTSR